MKGNNTEDTTALIISGISISDTTETAVVDTGKIVFSSTRDGNQQIYIMNADGTNQTRLTNNSATDTNPKLSADGQKIVFDSNRDGNQEIYVMNADGTDQTRITSNTFVDIQPAWSPDGIKIAFSSTHSGTPQIWVMNADGSDPVQLTFDPDPDTPMLSVRCYTPDWSYDGTRIAFRSVVFTNLDHISVINADGSNLVDIVDAGGMIPSVTEPAWSRDNMHIAISLTPIGYQGYNGRIMIVDSNGSNGVFLSSSDFDFAPAYSPDGSKIAFYSRRDGNNEIYIMNIDGNNETRLTNNAADDSFPSWGPTAAKVATPPTVATAGASAITISSATLNGNLTSLGTTTQANVSFEYGTTTSYGSTAAGVPLILTSAGAFAANLTGLTPGQTYHFRTKAVGDGTVYGNDMTFAANQLPFTITSISPDHGIQGQTLSVIINGNYFTGATSVSSGSGIIVNNFTVDSSTQITASITIDASAATGARDISVTTQGGTDALTSSFIVNVAETPTDSSEGISLWIYLAATIGGFIILLVISGVIIIGRRKLAN